jgi:hypothetical protein
MAMVFAISETSSVLKPIVAIDALPMKQSMGE